MTKCDRIIVIDLKATCCDDNSFPKEEMETIEIGAVVCDAHTYEPLGEFSQLVRPVRHPVLTEFCTQLTSITQDMVDAAEGFPAAYVAFISWVLDNMATEDVAGHAFRAASWGAFDDRQLQQDCAYHGMQYHMAWHINLADIYRKKMGGARAGNRRAMKRLGITPEGTHHRGLDDARNIAKMLPMLLGET